jgi:hypothetical protein
VTELARLAFLSPTLVKVIVEVKAVPPGTWPSVSNHCYVPDAGREGKSTLSGRSVCVPMRWAARRGRRRAWQRRCSQVPS